MSERLSEQERDQPLGQHHIKIDTIFPHYYSILFQTNLLAKTTAHAIPMKPTMGAHDGHV